MIRFVALAALVLPVAFTSSACQSTTASDTVLCSCGMEKGTDGCCDPTAETCGSCDKIKGSPGCCK